MVTVICRVCVCIYIYIYVYTYIYISTHVWLYIYIYYCFHIVMIGYYDWLWWFDVNSKADLWFIWMVSELNSLQNVRGTWYHDSPCMFADIWCANMICPGYKWKDRGTSHLHSDNIIKHAWHIYMAPNRNWFTSLAGCETCTAVRANKTHQK